ncbi:MAG: hypothetical protein ACLR4Z_17320 [Butyricicoccaceae bacterium]
MFCEVGTQPVGKTEFSTGKKALVCITSNEGFYWMISIDPLFSTGYSPLFCIRISIALLFFRMAFSFFFQRSAKAVAFAGERSNCGFGFLLK